MWRMRFLRFLARILCPGAVVIPPVVPCTQVGFHRHEVCERRMSRYFDPGASEAEYPESWAGMRQEHLTNGEFAL